MKISSDLCVWPTSQRMMHISIILYSNAKDLTMCPSWRTVSVAVKTEELDMTIPAFD